MVKLKKKLYLCFQSLSKYVLFNLLKKKRRCHIFYLILFIFFTIETLTYYYAAFLWYPIKCVNRDECTRILLVADPQLIGLQNEHVRFLTPLTIWDSDRYLSKTYNHAYKFTQPDVVIFLGDLLDEGSTATEKEFASYVERFYAIFQKDEIEYIWIPGDNDIGGEYADYITRHKIERFEEAFAQEDIIIHKNIRFNKINRLTNQAPTTKDREPNYTDVVLSHLNLLVIPTFFVENVLDRFHPKIIFTAHTHKAMIIRMNEETKNDRLITPIRPDNTEVYEYNLKDDYMIEFVVPTCSYRMGTDKIGYGFAVIESNAIKFTVFWTPSRLLQLKVYFILCVILFFYFLCGFCCSCKKADTTQYSILERIA